MKTNLCFFLSGLALLLSAAVSANAAVMVIDDFATGGFSVWFSVSDSRPTMRESGLLSLMPGGRVTRLTHGEGWGFWHATSTPQDGGSMNYTLELRGDPPYGVNWLDIGYLRSGGFDLSGYEAFSLSIGNLVGRGEVIAYSGSSEGIPVPITGTGELLIPFEMMQSPVPTDRLTSLHFRFIGLTADFLVTVDRIAAVPEPSGALLALPGVLALLARRRRARIVQR